MKQLQQRFHKAGKDAKAQRVVKAIQKPKPKTQHYYCRVVGGEVAEDLFNRGLCLPPVKLAPHCTGQASGTAMTEGDVERVVETVLNSRPG